MKGNYFHLNISENNENKTLISNNDKTIILTIFSNFLLNSSIYGSLIEIK